MPTPMIEVDAETYEVAPTASSSTCGSRPRAAELAQRYFWF